MNTLTSMVAHRLDFLALPFLLGNMKMITKMEGTAFHRLGVKLEITEGNFGKGSSERIWFFIELAQKCSSHVSNVCRNSSGRKVLYTSNIGGNSFRGYNGKSIGSLVFVLTNLRRTYLVDESYIGYVLGKTSDMHHNNWEEFLK
jgi:hypothetical protein